MTKKRIFIALDEQIGKLKSYTLIKDKELADKIADLCEQTRTMLKKNSKDATENWLFNLNVEPKLENFKYDLLGLFIYKGERTRKTKPTFNKAEKAFRQHLKSKYIDYLEMKEISDDDDKYFLRLWYELSTLEEVAKLLFPNINVELCETKWKREYRKENGIQW